MQSKWGKDIYVHTFIRKGFKRYRYDILNYLYLSSPHVLLIFKDENKMQFVNQFLAWVHWKNDFT
jgi:hypothetical protein